MGGAVDRATNWISSQIEYRQLRIIDAYSVDVPSGSTSRPAWTQSHPRSTPRHSRAFIPLPARTDPVAPSPHSVTLRPSFDFPAVPAQSQPCPTPPRLSPVFPDVQPKGLFIMPMIIKVESAHDGIIESYLWLLDSKYVTEIILLPKINFSTHIFLASRLNRLPYPGGRLPYPGGRLRITIDILQNISPSRSLLLPSTGYFFTANEMAVDLNKEMKTDTRAYICWIYYNIRWSASYAAFKIKLFG